MTRDLQGCKLRFEKWIDKSGDCWVWIGSKLKTGYGQFNISGSKRAHRIAYELYVGEIPSGMDVCHKCDNRSCVNPEHLFLGTRLDNMQDAKKKGRHAYGMRNGRHKIDEATVLEIRNMQLSQAEIGRHFGVHQSLVSLIKTGKRWSHL